MPGMEPLVTADGLRLFTCEWPVPGPRGTVLVVHGLSEHVGRYAHVAAALNAAGWRVAGYDHRGHGRSEGARGVIAADDSLLADLAQVVDATRASSQGPQGPLVLLGDSMGGAVAGRFVAEALAAAPAPWSRPVEGLVLASPALAAAMSAWQKLLLAVLGRLAPGVAVASGLDSADLSHDPEVARAYDADPLVHDRICARLARFILDAGAAVRAAAPRWTLPTLLVWGGADRIVPPAGSRAFALAAPSAHVTTHEYPGLYHELFNETEKAAVLAELTRWLQRLA
jgi:alpha-beta hydrolase superfamily lysophospholipase